MPFDRRPFKETDVYELGLFLASPISGRLRARYDHPLNRGAGREALLSHIIARPTEFAQPGSVVDSLILDDDGRVADFVLAVIDEDRTLVVSEHRAGAGEDMRAVALLLESTT